MSLERQINDIIAEHKNVTHSTMGFIEQWTVNSIYCCPFSTSSFFLSSSYSYLQDKPIIILIDYMIEHASTAECLTSPAQYIRECKKWYINKEKG